MGLFYNKASKDDYLVMGKLKVLTFSACKEGKPGIFLRQKKANTFMCQCFYI